ncbi:unnamed protein product [Rotaria sp. Silwood1]|nr:unnamed protein product [Rotaria sp. Silwood1]CAF1660060.1 unnamed protein product [Rotaria sp. Silwood1]
MSNNRNNEQLQHNVEDRQRKLPLSAPTASHQEQIELNQRQYQSQFIQQRLPQLQSAQGLQQEQEQKKDKHQKKKSRGDRKRQRYRAKLRKRGLNDEEITALINTYNNGNQGQDDGQSTLHDMNVELLIPVRHQQEMLENENVIQTTSVKRKRETRPIGITTSLSQMSIANLPKKRQRPPIMANIGEEKEIGKTRSNNKPKYLKVPDQIFKDMLSKSLACAESIVQLLDTPEKLQFVRTYADILNNVFYLKLEKDFWEHYNTVCISEAIWSSCLTKEYAQVNNLCRFKFKTKAQIEKHCKLILNRLQEAENNLTKHKQQPINELIDMNTLSTMITAFVRQGQHKLTAEFDQKKLILQFDANDHRLVKTFYNFSPNENQIRSAKIIWQATKDKLLADEQVAILKQRIYTKRLPPSFAVLDHSIDNMENMLKQPALNNDKRATLSYRRLKTIAQFKYDMMILTISTAEETVRSHANIIANEKKKLIDTAGGQVPLPKPLVQLMNTIAARQSPKYVPPCQSRFSGQTVDKFVTREYDNIVQCFENGLTKNCISYSDPRAKDFFIAVENLIRRFYATPLPRKLFTRAQNEYRMIKSIQRQLKKSNVILRITDKSKVFHLGSVYDYSQKALQYMHETNAYREITSGINPCQNHVQTVLALIDPMLKKREINREIWKQYMRPNVTTTELAHLYFIPKPHKIGTPLRPIVSSIKAAATGVSHFLDILLRPMFNRVAKQTTFLNGIDFVRQMETYRNSGRLLPTTLFVTFDVTNLYTMIPRDGAIFALQKFLHKHGENRRIHGMTIDTITRLARLVLDTNCFVYEKKYYQQIRGGAMGSPFTMTLANIYMWEWEQSLIEHQKVHNELYGRYIDDVFMTTNLSLDQIKIRLNIADEQDENIRITHTIGSTVEFLDVLVENNHGQLKTSVFHKPAAEPYILPFLSDHPRHIHRSTAKSQLLRAARLCSHVEDFDRERLNIEFTLLLNDYPLKFIAY